LTCRSIARLAFIAAVVAGCASAASPPTAIACSSVARDWPTGRAEALLMQRIQDLTNIERRAAGLEPFTLQCNDKLQRIAAGHSRNMARDHLFGHVDAQGRRPLDRVLADEPDFRGMVAENVAMLAVSSWRASDARPNTLIGRSVEDLARQFMTNWMESPGHRANILRPQLRQIGIGVYVDSNAVYVTQLFSGSAP